MFTPGARYPLAGLLLALPPLEDTGLLDCAREVYGKLRNGYYGLAATLLTLVFLAKAGEPRAEGATRVPPGALGRVLGPGRAPEVKTIRRKLGELAGAARHMSWSWRCTDDRGREHDYDLADTTADLLISEGPRKGQTVSLRQVTRRVPARGGGTRQIHVLTSRTGLPAGEVCWRMSSRWREENYFRYARTRFALDVLDSHAASPDDRERMVPNPAKKAAAAQVRRAEALAGTAEAARDARLLELRSPAPGQVSCLTNQIANALNAPVEAAYANLPPPRTPRRPSRPGPGSATSPPTLRGLRPRSGRSPTPSGWPHTTPRPPWPAP
ncbi:MAG TPA: hypothetical protein DEH11_04845 [Actinobacteria bacterium]|nr:hypothetical protein [Actinomycetota bacterium]